MSKEAMQQLMDATFKYKPGDIVTTKALVLRWRALATINGKRDRYAKGNAPGPITVICRELEECHGGFQPKYVTRHEANPDVLVRYMDHELVDYSEAMAVAEEMKPEPETEVPRRPLRERLAHDGAAPSDVPTVDKPEEK